MRKQYYKCLKLFEGETKVEYWRTSTPVLLQSMYDFIIPLGTRKPASIDKENIKE